MTLNDLITNIFSFSFLYWFIKTNYLNKIGKYFIEEGGV